MKTTKDVLVKWLSTLVEQDKKARRLSHQLSLLYVAVCIYMIMAFVLLLMELAGRL